MLKNITPDTLLSLYISFLLGGLVASPLRQPLELVTALVLSALSCMSVGYVLLRQSAKQPAREETEGERTLSMIVPPQGELAVWCQEPQVLEVVEWLQRLYPGITIGESWTEDNYIELTLLVELPQGAIKDSLEEMRQQHYDVDYLWRVKQTIAYPLKETTSQADPFAFVDCMTH